MSAISEQTPIKGITMYVCVCVMLYVCYRFAVVSNNTGTTVKLSVMIYAYKIQNESLNDMTTVCTRD